jgi:hypothetical protein
MATPEGRVKEYLLGRVKKYGFKAYKTSFENQRGCPDWLVVGGGHHAFIELKSAKGKLSPWQEEVIATLKSAGAMEVFVCACPEEVDAALGEFFK